MKKILHIFPDTLFLERYLEITNKDKKNKHYFILTDIGSKVENKDKYNFEKVSAFKVFDFIKLRKLLKKEKYNLYIIHSGYLDYLALSFFMNKRVLRKSILVLWGGTDSKKLVVDKYKKNYLLHIFIYEMLKKNIYRNVKYIASIIKDDYKSVKRIYNVKAKYLPCKYLCVGELEKNTKPLIKKTKHKNIFVGHSGSPECNHIDAFKELLKYKDEDIRIYSPLSYGDDKYIKDVINAGKSMFGDKFIPELKLMSPNKYRQYLMSMDVIIVNTKIQQALGNIHFSLFNQKKVYLNSKGKLWKMFNKEGFKVYEVDEISKLTFKEFLNMDDKSKQLNSEKIIALLDYDKILDIWQKIFEINI